RPASTSGALQSRSPPLNLLKPAKRYGASLKMLGTRVTRGRIVSAGSPSALEIPSCCSDELLSFQSEARERHQPMKWREFITRSGTAEWLRSWMLACVMPVKRRLRDK